MKIDFIFYFFFFPRKYFCFLNEQKLYFWCKMNVKCGDLLAENPEHVPLLLTPAAASKHQNPNATATAISIPNNITNGNGFIDNSGKQRPISPVLLSSNSPAFVMRSRLNQYKETNNFKNSIIVNFDGENASTAVTTTKSKKMKKSVDI